ncbi:MAG: hypothetical protein JJU28_01765 [Cyclobacteriaceae bacterium]|nr:hypothetical protein [Cyclobacteriaceae bacterium]
MKNLQELSFEEATSINGGVTLVRVAYKVATWGYLALVGDMAFTWDKYVEALEDGYKSGYSETKKHY